MKNPRLLFFLPPRAVGDARPYEAKGGSSKTGGDRASPLRAITADGFVVAIYRVRGLSVFYVYVTVRTFNALYYPRLRQNP